MPIFKTYTGNAMLNNALMTVESLANLSKVEDVSPAILKFQFHKFKFWELYKRMKSYTMLFTRNNLLTGNDKEGWMLYKTLFDKILDNVEIEGKHQCEISGLRFNTTFSDFYILAEKEEGRIEEGQDINRCWFPLIGSLGSDAQALPQAIFDIRIHPVCLVIIQFLPLSALIYKGSILLFDTANFDFARDFIAQNVTRVQEEIALTSSQKSIENIKDSDRGKYMLRAIDLYFRKQRLYADSYTDINLWSFTNSGTGASCEVDRIPNHFFKKLVDFYSKTECRPELCQILTSDGSGDFLRCLENGYDYPGLYPSKGSEGKSVGFFEEYQRQIGKGEQLGFAKYIASLIAKAVLSKSNTKLLLKADAYSLEEYPSFLQKILIEASERNEWSLGHQLSILDQPEEVPIKNSTNGIFKKVHFYYQKSGEWEPIPLPDVQDPYRKTMAGRVCAFSIRLIEKDASKYHIKHAEKLGDARKIEDWRIFPALVRQAEMLDLAQASIIYCTNFRLSHYGLSQLLRFFYAQPIRVEPPLTDIPDAGGSEWTIRLEKFAEFYLMYYLEKYGQDEKKFEKHVLGNFPDKPGQFLIWLTEAFDKIQEFYSEREMPLPENLLLDMSICQDAEGYQNLAFSRFAVEYCLNRSFNLKKISSL